MPSLVKFVVLVLFGTALSVPVFAANPLSAGVTTSGTTVYANMGITRLGQADLPTTNGYTRTIGLDADRSHIFFFHSSPMLFIKVAVRDGAAPGVQIANLRFPDDSGFHCASSVIDPAAGYAYLGMSPNNYGTIHRIVKVALGSGDAPPQRIGAVDFYTDKYTSLYGGLLDAAHGYAYFLGSAYGIGGPIIKVALGQGNALPTIKSTTYLPAGDDYMHNGVIDPATGYAYFFGGYGDPAFVMVGLGSGTSAPYRVGALDFWMSLPESGCIDTVNGFIYLFVGRNSYYGTPPQRLYKLKINASSAPTSLGSLDMNYVDSHRGVIDPDAGYGYWRRDSSTTCTLDKFNLGVGSAAPSLVGTTQLPIGDMLDDSFILDPVSGYAYGASTLTNPQHMLRIALSNKSLIQATSFTLAKQSLVTQARLYSHQAAGSVRMALYANGSTTRTLLWQSNPTTNTVARGWFTIPISAGTPQKLILGKGSYYLAWQINTSKDVVGYTAGKPGDGFYVPMQFKNFPAALSSNSATSWTTTSSRWSANINYLEWSSVGSWRKYD